MQKHQLNAQDRVLGLGLRDEETTYFTLAQNSQLSGNQPIVAKMMFELDDEISYESRTVYTIFDLLGDVGGLFESLKILSKLLFICMHLLFGSNLNRYLVFHLFKTDFHGNRQPNTTLFE